MAEIDKVIEEEVKTPTSEEVDIEVEGEEPTTVEEAVNETEEFFKNLAEDMSDETLQRMSNQLLDDYKDLTSSSEQLHKNPVQDLSMGELTFPLIMLMSKATPEDQDRLTHIFQNKEIDQIDWILEKLSEYAISEEISTLVRTYLNNAQSALSNIPDNDYKDCLNSLVEATREKLNDVVYQ